VTSLIAAPNRFVALTAPGGAGTILALTAIFFVLVNNLKPSTMRHLLYALICSATLAGLVAVYQYLGIGQDLIPTERAPWLANKLFSPAGSPLALIAILATGLSLAIIIFLKELSQEKLLSAVVFGGACVVIAVGLAITSFQLLPGKDTSLVTLSYPDSWAIGIEAFKQNPLFGVGPGNYPSAFNRFRPVSFNNNEFWNTRFGNASSYPLEILTIGGFLVLGSYLFLLGKTLLLGMRVYRRDHKDQLPILIGLFVVLFLPWLIGSNLIFLALTFLFLAGLASLGRQETISFPSKTPGLIALGLGLLLVIPAFYFWGRVYAAEIAFRQSLEALNQNQGLEVYSLQIKAIQLNPYSPNYRRAYSQTNLGLANSIATQTDLTDQDRDNISQLVQQAIREAKIATTLNPIDAINWENLAQIYRNLLNFAQGADQWAIAAYRQAIVTDPINPRLRVNLGGLFYSLQDYETALRQFENAIGLKPDYANGYYNLAATYREREMYPQAYQAMQIVVSLIPGDSADYQTAINELNDLAEKLPAQATPSAQKEPAKPEEALTEPEPLPSPIITPPIELPEESGPEISPTSTPRE
ncbi:MAG TPA: tetratricopeptide repeat protein, partial [Candidatus Bathyarchaeia archaeon]|nr:tetratricopeptide repeat protein [Candidatus Bathyarchaeia archaeon]